MSEDFSSRALLLYGPRKSGSSLLHNLLDGGSHLLMLPGELKIKPLVQKQKFRKTLVQHYVQRGRLGFTEMLEGSVLEPETLRPKAGYHFTGLSVEQMNELFDLDLYVQRLREMLLDPPESYGAIVQRDVEAFREALKLPEKKYSCWAAKEVGGNTEELIPFFQQTFPVPKIIYIARDPRFVVRSIVMDRRRKGIHLGYRGTWDECKRAQVVINHIYQSAFDNPNAIVVIYEKLTENLEAEMRRIAKLLEIPFEPILCQPTTLGVPVVVRTSSQKTTAVFKPEADWKKDLTPAQVAAIKLFHAVKPLRYNLTSGKYSGKYVGKYVKYSALLTKYEASEKYKA
jgi:hypothetical protein